MRSWFWSRYPMAVRANQKILKPGPGEISEP